MTPTSGIPMSLSHINATVAYHVPVSLPDCICSLLLDTGVAVTIFNTRVWQKCFLSGTYSLVPTVQQLVGITRCPLTVQGSAVLLLTIGKIKFDTSLTIVDNLTEERILGLDILQRNHCTFDFQKQVLHFPDCDFTLSLQTKFAIDSSVINDAMESTTVIPGQSKIEVCVSTDNFDQHSGVWLLEIHLSKTAKQGALAARAIVTPHNRLVTRLINPTDTATTVRKGTKVAVLSQLHHDTLATTKPSLSKVKISQAKRTLLWNMVQQNTYLTDYQQHCSHSLLMSYADLFALQDDELGQTGVIKHKINTGLCPSNTSTTSKNSSA